MINLSIIVLSALLNRFRGGGFGGGWIREKTGIHPRIFAATGLFVVSLSIHPWFNCLDIAVAYLIFVSAPWGRWYTLGFLNRDTASGPPNRFERFVENLSDIGGVRRDWLAFALRNFIMGIPVFFIPLLKWPLDSLFLIVAIVWAWVFVGCYWIGWRIFYWTGYHHENGGTPVAEMIAGALIGVMLVGYGYA